MQYELLVFDLDFTLWDAGGTWCDQTIPPYRRINNHVQDGENSIIRLYPEVTEILEKLTRSYPLGIASRTFQPDWAMELLKLFGIKKHFRYFEIYPDSKIRHFEQLQRKSGIPLNKMAFFDDEMRNIEQVGKLGVKTYFVRHGINKKMVSGFL